MEEHLTDELTVEKVAAEVYLSSFYFQKGFSIMCGVTVSEYIRNRRLSLAGRDIHITLWLSKWNSGWELLFWNMDAGEIEEVV